MALEPGQPAPELDLPTIGGGRVNLEDYAGRRVALVFLRFAGCPACNLHVRQLRARYAELRAAGLSVVAIFHSPVEELEANTKGEEFPFPIAGDPERSAYDAFGLELSWSGMFSPAFMGQAMRGMLSGFITVPIGETINGLPGDFIIDESGSVSHAHYGRHAGDSLDVDELLELAKAADVSPS